MSPHPKVRALLIVLVACVAYAPVIGAGWIWDDDSYVTNNPILQMPDGLLLLWMPGATPQYYPVVFSSFWLEMRLFGLDATGYHVTNVLLHAGAALLTWRLAQRLRIPGAWIIGLVFAAHPIHVESVAWVTERKNVLSAVLYLLAFAAYLDFDREDAPRRWGRYALALGCFVLALLSKTVTCSLPAAIVLAQLWLRRPMRLATLAPLIPFFVIGFALAMQTAALERDLVGAAGAEFDRPMLERLIIACRALLFYPAKIVWPDPVMFVYPRWAVDPGAALDWWPVAVVMLVVAACVAAWIRGHRGPPLLLAFYAGTIFPALGFVNVYPHRFSFVADHFAYLASLGVIATGVAAASRGLCRVPRTRGGVAGAIILVYVILTFQHVVVFRDVERLYRDTIAKNPEAWFAHGNLASLLVRRAAETREPEIVAGLMRDARVHAEAAVALKDDDPPTLGTLAELDRIDARYDEAIALQRKALAIVESRLDGAALPYAAGDHAYSLGRSLLAAGRPDEAIDALAHAAEIQPDNVALLTDLAAARFRAGDLRGTLDAYERLLALRPDDVAALITAGRLARDLGAHADAVQYLGRAIARATDPVRRLAAASDLARLLATSDDPAVRDLTRAVDLAETLCAQTQRRIPGLLDVLASIYFEAGRPADAVATAEEAVGLAESLGMQELAASIADRLEIYRSDRD